MPSNVDQIQWAKDVLQKQVPSLNINAEIVLETPYSSVIRFSTSQGIFYLKKTPPLLFIEADIIQFLRSKTNEMVPLIIGINKKLHCFLMADSGIPLRDILKINFDSQLLVKSLRQYTHMQNTVSDKIDDLLELGVPDWRLKRIPSLYEEIISQTKVIQKDGLTKSDFEILHNLYPTLCTICETLSHLTIPETFDHCDFHDNNILINPDNKELTLIDLGEVVITHPFFSLLSFISKTAFRYSLDENHPVLAEMLDVCCETWLAYGSKEKLKNAIVLAKKIWPIYSALGYYRLMTCSGVGRDDATLISYFCTGRNSGRFSKYFIDFIKENQNIEPEDLSHVKLSDPGSRQIK